MILRQAIISVRFIKIKARCSYLSLGAYLLCLSTIFSSCATVLNRSTVKVKLHANQPLRMVHLGDTLTRRDASFTLTRSSERQVIQLENGTLKDSVVLHAKNSAAYYLNFFSPLYLGFIYELNKPKRFTYHKHRYLHVLDTAILQSRFAWEYDIGSWFLHTSLPHLNNFYFQPSGEPDVKRSTGFLGFALGLDYYHRRRQYLSLKASAMLDAPIPVPAAIEYEGTYTISAATYLSLANSHKFHRWSLGYGIAAGVNTWRVNYRGGFEVPPPTRSPKRTMHWTMGLVFPVYYQTSRSFHLGIVYRPSFYRFDLKPSFQYEHILSLDLAWKFKVQ